MELILDVAVGAEELRVSARNPGAAPCRIWSRRCSWGWWSWTVTLERRDLPGDRCRLRPAPRIWTRNVPIIEEIPPQDHVTTGFGPRDFDPDDVGIAAAWRPEALLVAVVLDIAHTAEASAEGIKTGRWQSAPTVSEPPHGWFQP